MAVAAAGSIWLVAACTTDRPSPGYSMPPTRFPGHGCHRLFLVPGGRYRGAGIAPHPTVGADLAGDGLAALAAGAGVRLISGAAGKHTA